MKKHKITKYLVILGLATLSACSLDPMEIPQEELYLREFIKKFGLIDPSQTWNMAEASNVTVIPNGHASSVKVYGKSGDKYYICANITDVNKSVTIPIDVPNTVTELKVVVDGEKYFTTKGGTVKVEGVASRSYMYNDTGVNDGIVVSDGKRKYFPVSDVKKLFQILPEKANGRYDEKYPGNLFEPDIKTNFLLTGKGEAITIYPIYWNTIQTHELGIYYTPSNGDIDNTNIVRVPLYKMQKPPQFENLCFRAVAVTGDTELAVDGKAQNSNSPYRYKCKLTDAEMGGTSGTLSTCRTFNFGTGSGAFKAWGARSAWNEGYTSEKHYYDNQFYIPLNTTLEKGKSYVMTFRCKADPENSGSTTNTNFSFETHTVDLGTSYDQYYQLYNSPALKITQDWTNVTASFTVGETNNTAAPGLPNYVVINIGAYQNEAASFYFTDISVKEQTNFKWEVASSEWASESYRKFNNTYRPLANAYEFNWTYINPNNVQNVTSPRDHIAVGMTNQVVETYSTASESQYPPQAVKDAVTNGMSITYEQKYQQVDLTSAHLLMSNSDGGDLLTPLADVAWPGRTCAWDVKDTDKFVVSKGINVTVPKGLRYGFYIHFTDVYHPYDDLYVYSEVEGNIDYMKRMAQTHTGKFVQGSSLNVEDPQDRLYATFCAMFEQDGLTDGLGHNMSYRYLTFEDWIIHSNTDEKFNGDYDLNDLAFLVMNVDDDDIEEHPDEFNYLICCEDLGSKDDFDFNDMIVGVKIITMGTGDKQYKKVTFTALAAGGTLPLHLCYAGNTWDPVNNREIVNTEAIILHPDDVKDNASLDQKEWHRWFGVDNPSKMINTYNTSSYRNGKFATINVPMSFTLENFGRDDDPDVIGSNKSINGIFVRVNCLGQIYDGAVDPDQNFVLDTQYVLTSPEQGDAPQMFLIPDHCDDYVGRSRSWIWASERTPIYEVYPDFFNWAASGHGQYIYWYQHPQDPSTPGHAAYGRRPITK